MSLIKTKRAKWKQQSAKSESKHNLAMGSMVWFSRNNARFVAKRSLSFGSKKNNHGIYKDSQNKNEKRISYALVSSKNENRPTFLYNRPISSSLRSTFNDSPHLIPHPFGRVQMAASARSLIKQPNIFFKETKCLLAVQHGGMQIQIRAEECKVAWLHRHS